MKTVLDGFKLHSLNTGLIMASEMDGMHCVETAVGC